MADVLRRLLARLAQRRADQRDAPPPELVTLEREAAVAMAACTCGHIWHQHLHPSVRTSCAACHCSRFRPARTPRRDEPA